MIYKPLNNFLIDSNLKYSAWDSKLILWLRKNYPDVILKNDSNIWECLKVYSRDIVSMYKQIKFFLNEQINNEENITRLKNLVYINCFGINIENALYLIGETSKYIDCLSIYEKDIYNVLCSIGDSKDIYEIRDYNEKYQNNSISAISKIRNTLDNNYRRLLANYSDINHNRTDKSDGVDVHYLNNEKFRMVVGVVSEGKINSANSYKKKTSFKSYLSKLKSNFTNNPGILSANIICNDNIGLFSEGEIIFGYEYIPIRKIIGMNTGDCFKKVNKKLLLDNLYFDDPFSLLQHMTGNAVEVVIDMKDEPILPTYIVAIDNIKETDVNAAKILNLPIYVINSKCCYESRLKQEKNICDGIDKITDDMNYLRALVKLYKYQEQTLLINTGVFDEYKEDTSKRLDTTYSKIGNAIKKIYNSCVFDNNLSIRQRLDNMERLMNINTFICDISYVSSVTNKKNGRSDFNCFFTEYSSHTKFMNEMIEKIEEKFSTKINTYALICLASLKCNLQDFGLKTCYEELTSQAFEYLKYFNFKHTNLVRTGIFNSIQNYNSVKVYSDSNTSILLNNGKLECVIQNNVYYKVVAKTDNNIKLSKVNYSYICKGADGSELEVQVLKDNNFRVISNKKLNISYRDFKPIDNQEYVIN